METQKTCYGVPYQTNKIVPKFCKRIENFWNIIVTCECSGKVIWFIMKNNFRRCKIVQVMCQNYLFTQVLNWTVECFIFSIREIHSKSKIAIWCYNLNHP